MKAKSYKILLLLMIYVFLHNSKIFPGIVSGTLVSTPNGLVPIQKLNVGDTVIGYCLKCKKFVKSPITKIRKKKNKKLVLININNENLLVTKKHIFFDPMRCKWVRARNLTRKNYLTSYDFVDNDIALSKTQYCSVQKTKNRSTVYEISLKYPHTFFISKSRILVHNIVCSLGLGLAFGSGMISIETIAVAASFLGLGLCSMFGRKSKIKTHVTYNPCNQNYSPNKKLSNEKNKKPGKPAKAPGKPTEKDGFKPPKGKIGNGGKMVKHPETGQRGWKDAKGKLWVPTGEGPLAHGGPHWDIIDVKGRHLGNKLPGGKWR